MLGIISYSADMDVITVHAICYLTFMNSNLQNKVPTIISCFTVACYTEAWWLNIHSVHVFVVDLLVEFRLNYLAKHISSKKFSVPTFRLNDVWHVESVVHPQYEYS